MGDIDSSRPKRLDSREAHERKPKWTMPSFEKTDITLVTQGFTAVGSDGVIGADS